MKEKKSSRFQMLRTPETLGPAGAGRYISGKRKGGNRMSFFAFDVNGIVSAWIVIIGIQAVFFVAAALLKRDTFTDITYSLTFVVVALFLLFARRTFFPTQVIVAAGIGIWGVRLGAYLFTRILTIKKDSRFDGIREHPLKFGRFWALQGITIAIIMVPAIVVLNASADPFPRTPASIATLAVGILGWAAGLLVEAVADGQRFAFRNNPANQGKWIASGLWRLSRHPNYFGEMLCWWGMFLVVAPGLSGFLWLAVLGPVFITLLLRFVSGIPLLEKQADKKYGSDPAYREYKRSTRLLFPLPKRKAGAR
jgi:steroid 5-alpha reductase family enzyme